MAILIVMVYLALAACVQSQPIPASVPELPVYEWIGPGRDLLLEQLALSLIAMLSRGQAA